MHDQVTATFRDLADHAGPEFDVSLAEYFAPEEELSYQVRQLAMRSLWPTQTTHVKSLATDAVTNLAGLKDAIKTTCCNPANWG